MSILLAIAFGLSLVTSADPRHQATKETLVAVPPAVALRVEPLLDTLVSHRNADDASDQFLEVDRLEGRLMQDKSPDADEALIVLAQFNIGESTAEDLHHEITKRGRRMLSYLRKYRRGLARIPGRVYPDSIRLDPSTWKGLIDEDIESIQKGKVRFSD